MTKGTATALAIGGAVAVGVGVALAIGFASGQPGPGQGTLSVNSDPSGISFTVDSAGGTTPFSAPYTANNLVMVTMPQSVTIAGTAYSFQSWSDGDTSLVKQVTIPDGGSVSLFAQYLSSALIATVTTLTSSAPSAQVNQIINFNGRVARTDNNTGIPGVSVILESSTNQNTWSSMMTVTTDGSGNYAGSGSFFAAGTYYIRARFPGA